MRNILFGTLALSLLCSIISCNKDNSGDTVNPPPPTGQDTILSAVYAIDTTLPAPFDTIARYKVTFDALNRTSLITELDTRPNGDSDYYSVQAFIYNGTDINAARRTEYTRTFSGTSVTVQRDTSYYNFTNGKCIYDSVTSTNRYSADKFAYAGNTVLRNGTTVGFGNKSVHQSTIYQTFTNGNLTHQLDTLVSHLTTVTNPAFFSYQREEITTSYLPNRNPFYQVIKSFQRPYYYDDLGIGSAMAPEYLIAQQHQALTIWSNSSSGNNIYDLTYSYTFRADGYPLLARQTFIQNGLSEKRKFYFVYK